MIDDSDKVDKKPRPSKTQLKREMTELQKLGLKLVELNAKQLKTLELPEELAEAVALGQRITKHEALRRHSQYIGRIMRKTDEETMTRIKRFIEKLMR
jgi:ribosome-associated protein